MENLPTTTYQIGLAQDRAYRILKKNSVRSLKPFGIRPIEWAFLGFLYDNKAGMQLNKVAKILHVKPPFATRLADKLEDIGLIKRKNSPTDRRAKAVFLTEKGKTFVVEIELKIRRSMKPLLSDISKSDMKGYLTALRKIGEK